MTIGEERQRLWPAQVAALQENGEKNLLKKYRGSRVAIAVAFILGDETSCWASSLLNTADLWAARHRIELERQASREQGET